MGEERGWAAAWIRGVSTGIFIRDYLLEHDEGYPQEIWRALKAKRGDIKVCSYQSFFTNYVWVLKKLGLIEKVRTEPASNPAYIDRVYYRITPGEEENVMWLHPQKSLDPRRGLGSKRYKREKGKKESGEGK